MENEKRLIDANELMESFRKYMMDNYDKEKCISAENCEICGGCLWAKITKKAPTVDAVEVVRCEDCLYRSQYPDESGHYKCGGLLTEDEELLLMVKPDFFCAYGERRADEGRNSSV